MEAREEPLISPTLTDSAIMRHSQQKPPFPLQGASEGKTWKTVTDAWNGYHCVPLRENDRHLTTFITPWKMDVYPRIPGLSFIRGRLQLAV